MLLAGLLALYALSGTTIIGTNEVGMIVRLGALVGETRSEQVHGPGLLFALPRPFDEVVRINTASTRTIEIDELATNQSTPCEVSQQDQPDESQVAASECSASRSGLALTGDRNLLNLNVIARFTVRDPAKFTFGVLDPKEQIRSAVVEAAVRNLGELNLDRLLTQGRATFVQETTRDAQERLDQIGAGVQLVNVELVQLTPPEALSADFDAVQSAYIAAQTAQREAEQYAAEKLPAARAEADQLVSSATTYANRTIVLARAEAQSFEGLLGPYRASSAVLRERIYREGLERAFASGPTITFVPEPVRSRYNGMRLTFGPGAGVVRRNSDPERTSGLSQLTATGADEVDRP